MNLCHHCGKELRLSGPPARTDACPSCYSDVKVCLNCTYFDPGLNNQCREPQAEWQTDKAKANFCEFFEIRHVADLTGGGGAQAKARNARDAFDQLFKKKP